MTLLLLPALLLAVLLSGLPIFAGLILFSAAVLVAIEGGLGSVGEIVFGNLDVYLLVAIPLFMLMAHIMIRGGIVAHLFDAVSTFVRHLPGGLGIAAVLACTVFAAISGSSMATALTVGTAAIPLMIRHGYDPRYAFGAIGGGGTLGILIPPSGPMVLYGVISDTSIGALFMAGVVPGLMMAAIFSLWCMIAPGRPPRDPALTRPSLAECVQAVRKAFWALTLPVVVLGGMYFGVFTATEAAAVGALAALAIAVAVYRRFGVAELWAATIDAARTSSMLFMILAGAGLFGHVLTKMRIPHQLVEIVIHYQLGPIQFLIVVMLMVLVLGMFFETISIILITTPLVLPTLSALGINPVWYGILLTINLELALISPPLGMNLFAIKAISGGNMGAIIRGVAPYFLLMILGLGLVMAFPQIALWLPGTMRQ